MMDEPLSTAFQSYQVWRGLTYHPTIATMLPHALAPYLESGTTAVDIGCHIGDVTFYLAGLGLRTVGIDINPRAIAAAEQRARADASALPTFRVADVLDLEKTEQFDVVAMVRVLTCFSEQSSWCRLLDAAHNMLRTGGLVYVHDFLMADGSSVYSPRYAAGRRAFGRDGNFAVSDELGRVQFIAHHHTLSELRLIMEPYQPIEMNFHDSLSLHGNDCRMFEFIGRRSGPTVM